MSPQDTDHLITEAIQDHYKNNDSPFYLAELGKLFHTHHIEIPAGVRFKDYLKSRFHDRFVVVQDTEDPARIAIAPLEKESVVLQQLSHHPSTVGDESAIIHARLPFALVHELSPQEKRTIYEHIEKWADNNSIDLRQFYYDLGPKFARPPEELAQTEGNALLRLINAQEPEIRPQIRIPGDIASTLIQLP